jgi:ribosomal protein L17
MSENDNLHEADGKIETVTEEKTTTKETTLNVEETSKDEAPTKKVNPSEPEHIHTATEASEINEDKEPTDKEDPSDDKHVDEIEASNAEDAEDESNAERHDVEEKDYHAMSMDQLVTELNRLLKHHKIQTISKHVNQIKSEFNAKFEELLDEKKEEFINDGGNEIDFYYTNDTKKLFNQLYKEYRQNIKSYYREREQTLKQNLENRLAIIEEIKGLLNVEENINTTYKHFKELQERWRNSGPIPRDKYNNAWNTYHHHVERFYDFLHLNNDLRDLDFKHNYEQKLKIIERAEELAADDEH